VIQGSILPLDTSRRRRKRELRLPMDLASERELLGDIIVSTEARAVTHELKASDFAGTILFDDPEAGREGGRGAVCRSVQLLPSGRSGHALLWARCGRLVRISSRSEESARTDRGWLASKPEATSGLAPHRRDQLNRIIAGPSVGL
jgi:hypothetical protein